MQARIAEDPAILGLGDIILKDKERIQPRAGRLDLLLQDPAADRRYEVEVQLGSTDESHIIRTIEYWDIERKRYPQYEHCAVLVAEDVTTGEDQEQLARTSQHGSRSSLTVCSIAGAATTSTAMAPMPFPPARRILRSSLPREARTLLPVG